MMIEDSCEGLHEYHPYHTTIQGGVRLIRVAYWRILTGIWVQDDDRSSAKCLHYVQMKRFLVQAFSHIFTRSQVFYAAYVILFVKVTTMEDNVHDRTRERTGASVTD